MLVKASTSTVATATRNGVLLPTTSTAAALAATRTFTSTPVTPAKQPPKPAPLLLTSTSIRVTSDLYDRCAARAHAERHFWYTTCALPETYQSWFQITNLHVYLLLARFRAFERPAYKTYAQELINHFFIDAESRMRDRFGVQTSRLVKGYMRDMHMQQRGSVVGYDEGLVGGDERLAQAVWRNLWGAGWGTVAGVKRKLVGVDKVMKGEVDDPEGQPELARDVATLDPRLGSKHASPYARAASASLAAERANAEGSTLPPVADNPNAMPKPGNVLPPLDPFAAAHPELAFPHHLHRIVTFIRAESHRLANLSDREIMLGRVEPPSGAAGEEGKTESIAEFRRI